ncbi:uncharacterized protein K489DRAFT_377906 [Dissoconium aciculare CBS 342.82]|uniref:Uncharacterized protein n=1 Tax=Dissoconium aciculare CBS 342.82 TaxID=1314786 RepID=A0A6J3MBG0_9PEZI|nr:uncharacterized protein K489DRAFT_377906 [Dissoconium aciculare CBS 342.82]KAF1825356.1 hypothetical protein K489DRAFT_377906 [Dissoconium aciculare CBS 342.82]
MIHSCQTSLRGGTFFRLCDATLPQTEQRIIMSVGSVYGTSLVCLSFSSMWSDLRNT